MKRLVIISLICILAFSGCVNKSKVYMTTNSIISNSNDNIDNQIESSISKDTNQEDDIILYKGWVIGKEPKEQYADFHKDNYSEDMLNRLNRVYYNYENGKFIGVSEGRVIDGDGYDGTYIVDNVGKIAMSAKHNPILNTAITIEGIPQILYGKTKGLEKQKFISKIIDLDNDGKEEIIVGSKNDVTLYNSNGDKVARLLYQDERMDWGFEAKYVNEIEFLDIDGDNIIEVILPIPVYEGPPYVSILKYESGILKGEYNLCCHNP